MSQQHQINDSTMNKYKDFMNYDNVYFKTLKSFLIKYRITNTDIKANICDINPNSLSRYLIPSDAMNDFFDNLYECYKANLVLNFMELQTNDTENNIGSGLMLDFDILTDTEADIFNHNGFKINDLITFMYNIICEIIDMGKDLQEHYILIIKKPKPIYNDDLKKYKQGFHILMPNIVILRNVKKYIFDRFIQSEQIRDWFANIDLPNIVDIFDKGSVYVPTHFIGSCKPNSIPYNIHSVKAISIKYGSINGSINPIDNITTRFPNILHEFSLNHSREGGVIVKRQYSVKPIYFTKVNYYGSNHKDISFDPELETVNQDISLKSIYIPDILYIQNLLGLLSIDRITNHDTWIKIIFALSSGGDKYKSLAIWVSKRVPEKFNMFDFDTLWNSAINSNSINKLTMKSIRYWAQSDSPENYDRFSTSSVCDIIRKNLKDETLRGNLYDLQFAKLLQFMFENKFVTDYHNKKYIWYEFITDEDDHKPGELYKYRLVGELPDNLIKYLGDKMPHVLKLMVSELDYNIANSKDAKLLEYLLYVKKTLVTKTIVKLYKNASTNSILLSARSRFFRFNFANSLDIDPSIMGVENGVLKFRKDKPVELIQSYHPYYISMYTDTKYISYDENNIYVKKVYTVLKSLFPDCEQYVFEFIMFYFASSLDGFPKESIILILTGCGANGKSFLVEFLRNTLGDHYVRKLGMEFLLEKRGSTSSADPALMDLKYARQAYMSESNVNDKINIAKLKELTGGETMSARQLFKEQENFKPNCNYLITTNYGLTIETTEHATWRRILTVSFKMIFMENPTPNSDYERQSDPKLNITFASDPHIKSAFLSILTHYRDQLYSKYNGNLMRVPRPTIDKETNDYRSNQDVFNRFIDERAWIDKDVGIDKSDIITDMDNLCTAYRTWYRSAIGLDNTTNNIAIQMKYSSSKIGKYFTIIKGIKVLKGIKIYDGIDDEFDADQYTRFVNKV